MTTLRDFRLEDLFEYTNVTLDVLTEVYTDTFYMYYMSKWPRYFTATEDHQKTLTGYMIGKAEGKGEEWHGHISAVTVDPQFRRLGLARRLIRDLERTSEELYDTWFVDLFVRASNKLAIGMYEALGYAIYRTVREYYSADLLHAAENALDMRRPCAKDTDKRSLICKKRVVSRDEIRFD
ncbi:MAG: hypothetical protein MHM6MM_006694 [Cercozoa sp. M6MM]